MTPCRVTLQFFIAKCNVTGIYGLPNGFYSYPGGFYRTFLKFPHRLTIPAYEIRSLCIACIICFYRQIYKLPMETVTPWLSLRAPSWLNYRRVLMRQKPSRLSDIDTYYISSGICTYCLMGSPHAIICSPHRLN